MKEVEGKVAFVTGGDSGIGRGIVQTLLGAGMKVAITYRTKSNLDAAMNSLGSLQNEVHAIYLDVTDRRAMEEAAAETVRVFGRVHVLVNNAGVFLPTPLSNATFDDFDWCINVNVNGVFNGVRAFLPHIKSHGEGGHIVSTSSLVGGVVAGPFWGVYSTSKFAVLGMMEALRSELAGTDIGVSAFCPSAVDTNIRLSGRNRPPALCDVGVPDENQSSRIAKYGDWVQKIVAGNAGCKLALDPAEAGECVLRGIRNNDLYIFSHSEYEVVIRDRNEALLSYLPKGADVTCEARLAFAQNLRNSIYR